MADRRLAKALGLSSHDRSSFAQRPVRVCFVVENLIAAGTELWILRLIERLDRSLVQPLLCLTDGGSDASREMEPVDCPVLRLQLPSLKTLRLPSAMRQLKQFLKQHGVDIVQVHHADPTYLAVPVARWCGVPTIVQTKYDVGYWLQGTDLVLHRWLRRWIDMTVANCEACREAAIQQEGAPPKEVIVVDNGIPTEELSGLPLLTEASLQGTELRVGMLANLRPVKDPQNLLQAAITLAPELQQLSFHFAGHGELQAPMQQVIREHRLNQRVFVHGHVKDTVTFLNSLQIFVLCSKSEGLPHALLEAMAAGRAVIATEVGGNRELIQHDVNGLLVPSGDSQALAQAIRSLVNDPGRAVRFGAAARDTVAERFSLDAMTHRFESFYKQLYQQRSPDRPGRLATRTVA